MVDYDRTPSKRVELFLAELITMMSAAQAEVIAAKVPIGSYGRVKDTFRTLGERIHEATARLVAAELESLCDTNRTTVSAQVADLRDWFGSKAHERITALAAERDAVLAASEEREREARASYQRLVARREGSDELLEKSEQALRVCEQKLLKEKDKAQKLQETLSALEASMSEDNRLTDALAGCTLKAKKEAAVQDPTTGGWKRRQRTAAAQIAEQLDACNSVGAKVKRLAAIYEEERARASEEHKRGQDRMEVALAEAQHWPRAERGQRPGTRL